MSKLPLPLLLCLLLPLLLRRQCAPTVSLAFKATMRAAWRLVGPAGGVDAPTAAVASQIMIAALVPSEIMLMLARQRAKLLAS